MNPRPFPANSKADIVTLSIRENLISTNAAHFREEISRQLDAAAASSPAVVEVDLRGARVIDSVGLNLLVTVIKRAIAWGGKAKLLVDDPNVSRTLRFTRLDAHAAIVQASK